MASRDCPLCWKVEASLENISYIILAILSTISGVLSVASNLLVLAAIYSHSPLRKVSSFFIASLAVADFLIGLLVNSVYTSIFISKATEVDFNHPLRVTEHWLWLQSTVTSTFTLTTVSIERYIAVTKCFRYPEIVTVNRCTRCVAAIWVFSVLYASFRFAIRHAEDIPSLWISTTILTIFLPFFVISYCYIRIYKAARTQCARIAADNSINAEYCREVLKNKKAAWTLCIVTGVFALLWTPSLTLSFWDISTNDTCARRCINYLWYWAALLSFTSSFCNPWIYAIRMREFRLAFLKVLHISESKRSEEMEH